MIGLKGILPVVATPFSDDGGVDVESFDRIVDFSITAGVDGLVFPGNASEVEALSVDERQSLSERLARRLEGRGALVVGLSSADATAVRDLAIHARQLRADAVMISPPKVLGEDIAALGKFLRDVAAACQVPLILQNAPAPLGLGLAPAQMAALIREVPAIAYVKEECSPSGQRISQLLREPGVRLAGVFGGAAGRFIMEELRRGVIGSMPSCEIPELHVRLWQRYHQGDVAQARAIYERMLPLLLFTSVFRAAGVKALLRRRGVIASDFHRKGTPLDGLDREELAAIAASLGVAVGVGDSGTLLRMATPSA